MTDDERIPALLAAAVYCIGVAVAALVWKVALIGLYAIEYIFLYARKVK